MKTLHNTIQHSSEFAVLTYSFLREFTSVLVVSKTSTHFSAYTALLPFYDLVLSSSVFCTGLYELGESESDDFTLE